MAIFSPDTVIPTDTPSFQLWLNMHHLEHQQFVELIQGSHPTAEITLADLGVWPHEGMNDMFKLGNWELAKSAESDWVQLHQSQHEALWQVLAGGGGQDLTNVDPYDELSWRVWEQINAEEHKIFRAALGIV